MDEVLDAVASYARELGLFVKPRTVLVEGTSDVALFELAARIEHKVTGSVLLGEDLAIVAAGERDRGGVRGVVRELVALRGMSRTCLLPSGRPRYRFVGLVDNDSAGRRAVSLAHEIDSSILEYKDVFRLSPVMPFVSNLDPANVRKTFEQENHSFSGLDWELEDLLPDQFIEAFLSEYPYAGQRDTSINGQVHRKFTPDGKANLHQFVRVHAMHDDLSGVIRVLRSLRHYLALP